MKKTLLVDATIGLSSHLEIKSNTHNTIIKYMKTNQTSRVYTT